MQWRNFQYSEREQREVLDTLLEARDDLQGARVNLAETEEERLDAALDQIESWETQMQDIQRELEAMDNQETPLTPEQEAAAAAVVRTASPDTTTRPRSNGSTAARECSGGGTSTSGRCGVGP